MRKAYLIICASAILVTVTAGAILTHLGKWFYVQAICLTVIRLILVLGAVLIAVNMVRRIRSGEGLLKRMISAEQKASGRQSKFFGTLEYVLVNLFVISVLLGMASISIGFKILMLEISWFTLMTALILGFIFLAAGIF